MTYTAQPRIGSLFSGYGGLDMGVQSVLGGTVAWHCEVDPAPARILAHHWPDVPNLGDITTVDWTRVEPIDVLTGGFPCQDVSHAGRRAGLIRGEGGTRTGLWAEMLTAITTLRPRLVVAENVRGLLSARADSDMEPCPWCLGDTDDRPALRALGAVLGDLADVRYDTWWTGLRAADIGAPHGRLRVFIFAWPADAEGDPGWLGDRDRGGIDIDGCSGGGPERLMLLRTPTAQLAVNGGSQHPDKRRAGGHGPTLADEVEHLLPTPAASRSGRNQSLGPNAAVRPSLDGIRHLLPTPSVADALGGHLSRSGDRSGELLLPGVAKTIDRGRWGAYAPAIARWERVIGRPAPDPTEPAPKGGRRLSPRFVEFLMGTPAGHVTDPAIGLTRNQQLKSLGNGVVPQQSAAAARMWLAHHRQGAAA
jgi:DNA (cytosine-5)-methyltransferase 1